MKIKKILMLVGAVALLAAACNNSDQSAMTTQTNVQPTNSQAVAGQKVDATVNALNKGIDAEDSFNLQSDTDIVNSDTTLINGYYGVSNETNY